MKNFIFILVLFISSCNESPKNKEDILVENICSCHSDYSKIEAEMSYDYQKDIYPLDQRINSLDYHKNFLLDQMMSGFAQMETALKENTSRNKAEGRFKISIGLLRWELEFLRNISVKDFKEIAELPIEKINEIQVRELLVTAQLIKMHYRQKSNHYQKGRDEFIQKKHVELGKETYQFRYKGPSMAGVARLDLYLCLNKLLYSYLEGSGSISFKELEKRINEKCPGANEMF